MKHLNKLYLLIFLTAFISSVAWNIKLVHYALGAPSKGTATVIIGDFQGTPEEPENPISPIDPGNPGNPGDVTNPSFNCTQGGKAILVPGARRKLITGAGKTRRCYEARYIIMHYAAGNTRNNDATYNTLIQRGLSCMHGVGDKDNQGGSPGEVEQWLELFQTHKEEEYCTGTTEYNQYGISLEVAGNDFDNPSSNWKPTNTQYDLTLNTACFLMKQYNISINNVLGHNELGVGKPDPGAKWLAQFRSDLRSRCN